MTRVASASKTALARLLAAAKSAGIKPHIWIDPQGCPHLIEDDGLTAANQDAPLKEENPWDAYARS